MIQLKDVERGSNKPLTHPVYYHPDVSLRHFHRKNTLWDVFNFVLSFSSFLSLSLSLSESNRKLVDNTNEKWVAGKICLSFILMICCWNNLLALFFFFALIRSFPLGNNRTLIAADFVAWCGRQCGGTHSKAFDDRILVAIRSKLHLTHNPSRRWFLLIALHFHAFD